MPPPRDLGRTPVTLPGVVRAIEDRRCLWRTLLAAVSRLALMRLASWAEDGRPRGRRQLLPAARRWLTAGLLPATAKRRPTRQSCVGLCGQGDPPLGSRMPFRRSTGSALPFSREGGDPHPRPLSCLHEATGRWPVPRQRNGEFNALCRLAGPRRKPHEKGNKGIFLKARPPGTTSRRGRHALGSRRERLSVVTSQTGVSWLGFGRGDDSTAYFWGGGSACE